MDGQNLTPSEGLVVAAYSPQAGKMFLFGPFQGRFREIHKGPADNGTRKKSKQEKKIERKTDFFEDLCNSSVLPHV